MHISVYNIPNLLRIPFPILQVKYFVSIFSSISLHSPRTSIKKYRQVFGRFLHARRTPLHLYFPSDLFELPRRICRIKRQPLLLQRVDRISMKIILLVCSIPTMHSRIIQLVHYSYTEQYKRSSIFHCIHVDTILMCSISPRTRHLRTKRYNQAITGNNRQLANDFRMKLNHHKACLLRVS